MDFLLTPLAEVAIGRLYRCSVAEPDFLLLLDSDSVHIYLEANEFDSNTYCTVLYCIYCR